MCSKLVPELPVLPQFPFPLPARPWTPRFDPGRIVGTPAAFDLLRRASVSPATLFAKHQSGDWGDLCREDAAANEQALADGSRLLSSYKLTFGEGVGVVWIVTDAVGADGRRAASTILLPGDY